MMRTKKLFSLLLAAALCCTTLLAGCGGGSNGDPADTSGDKSEPADTTQAEGTEGAEGSEKLAAVQELVTAYNSDPITMDPAFSATVPDQRAQTPIYEGLTKRALDEAGNLVVIPAAAESWDVSEDETVYTFHLRKEGKWSDGTPVTAQDFDYAWRRVFDPEVASPQAWLLQDIIKNADACMTGAQPVSELGVKAIDDYTFEVTLEKPETNFISLCGYNVLHPVKKDLIDQYGSQYGSSVEKTVGNGPFILTAWEPGSQVSYVPNPHYWDHENVKLTKLTTKIITEVSTQAQALIANEVDVAGLNNPDWNDMVEQTGYYNVIEKANMEMEFMVFNCADPILKNPKIRLAISLAYDRDKYNQEVNDGRYVPTYGMTPDISLVGDQNYFEMMQGKNEVLKELAQKYPDPKALLLEGMKEEGLGDDPSKIQVHFYTRGVSEYVKKSAEWHKQEIEKTLGIQFMIEMTEWNILYDLMDSGDYQIGEAGWSADVDLEPMNFLELFTPDGGYYSSRNRWNDDKAQEYAALVKEMKAAEETDARAQAYLKGEQLLLEESPVSPIYSTKSRTLIGKYVHGYQAHPFVVNDYAHVYLTER